MKSYKSYDELFSEILTSYGNASPNASTMVGSELYIRAAGLASVVWGLYKEASWVYDQIFPTTSDPDGLLRHAQDLGLDKRPGESWSALLDRILAVYRNPSGGGNPTDYERWSMSVKVQVNGVEESATSVTCYPAKFGPGTVVLLVQKASGDPSQTLLDRIRDVVLENGPVVPAEVYVLKPSTKAIAISIQMAGGDRSKADSSILSYLATLLPGQTLQPVVIQGLCFQAGASSASITPSQPTIPGPFERIVVQGSIAWS
ncbi:MAG TPA: baseplate J/gp47 family protein [Fibrobacteria bacterium]|nr:baseplate J/gp47 family protein [Fibrobacteria bacterium]